MINWLQVRNCARQCLRKLVKPVHFQVKMWYIGIVSHLTFFYQILTQNPKKNKFLDFDSKKDMDKCTRHLYSKNTEICNFLYF